VNLRTQDRLTDYRLGGSLTCYTSHNAKHWKMADFDPSGIQNPEPILTKLGMVDYVRYPTSHDNFGGVAQRGWFGQCDLPNL